MQLGNQLVSSTLFTTLLGKNRCVYFETDFQEKQAIFQPQSEHEQQWTQPMRKTEMVVWRQINPKKMRHSNAWFNQTIIGIQFNQNELNGHGFWWLESKIYKILQLISRVAMQFTLECTLMSFVWSALRIKP